MKPINHKRVYTTQSNEAEDGMLSGRLPLIDPGPSKKRKNEPIEARSNQIAPLPEHPIKEANDSKEEKYQVKSASEDAKVKSPTEAKKVVYEHRNKALNITRMMVLVFSNYYFGYYLMVGGVLAPTLTELVYELPEEERNQVAGNFGFFLSVGCIFSNMFSGMLTRYIGRVKLIIVLEICRIICSLIYRIENLYVFYAMRFASGFLGSFGLALVPLIINEMIPSNLTGYGGCLAFTMITLFLIVGSIQSPLLGGKEGLQEHWQNVLTWPIALSIVSIVLVLLTMFGMESPNYYYEHYADKENVLKEKILAYAKRFYTDKSAEQYTNDFIAEKKRIREASKGKKITLKSMFGPKYRKQFLLGCALNMLQQLTGINFMMFFATQLFDEISGNGAFMTIVLAVGMFVGSLTSVFVVNGGRRTGMLYSTMLLVISHIILVFAISYEIALLASIGMFMFVWSFSLGFASIFAVYIVEILPPVGVGLAFSTQWVTSAIIGLAGAPMLDLVGVEVIIIVFIVCSVISCLIFWLVCKETSGKTEEEIRYAFTGEKAK